MALNHPNLAVGRWAAGLLVLSFGLIPVGRSMAVDVTLVDEDFDSYADNDALFAVWVPSIVKPSPDGILTSDTESYPDLEGQGVDHIGNSIMEYTGLGTVAPTATQNLVLQGDIFSDNNGNKRMSIGLRGGSSNIIELGFWNSEVVAGSGDDQISYAFRQQSFVSTGGNLNPDWRFFELPAGLDGADAGDRTTRSDIGAGWARYKVTVSLTGATFELDLGRDGMTVDDLGNPIGGPDSIVSFTNPPGAVGFNSLRIGSPSALSAGGPVVFDNISLMLVDIPTAGTIDGDYNDDGFVDAADYTVWRDNLGLMVTLPGDTTPGSVDPADFDVWQNAFGNPMAIGAVGSNPVPEPATLSVVAVLTLLGGLLARRNR